MTPSGRGDNDAGTERAWLWRSCAKETVKERVARRAVHLTLRVDVDDRRGDALDNRRERHLYVRHGLRRDPCLRLDDAA